MERASGLFRGRALWVCAGAALLSLWLRAGLPLFAIGGAALDDALFLELARALVEGRWLGDFDHRTLAKGMFYPLFAGAAFLANIPLKAAEQLVWLAVSAWFAALVARETASRRLGVLLFVLLAFNPLLWLPFMQRVVREGLYVSLALWLLGLWWATLFARGARESVRRRVALALLTGLAAGCFWLTREEGPWILPSLALLLAAALLLPREGKPLAAGLPRRAATLLLAAALPALATFMLTLGAVKGMNYLRYGAFETNEFHSRSFQRAYGALARIQHAQWQRYVVFPSEARRQAYAHSAAARELEPFFEGPDGQRWRAIGCTQTEASACPDILAGWFMWALREAVAKAGHYRDGRAAMAFYDRLADEIDAACEAGRIACLPPRATLAPPFRWHYLADALQPAKHLFAFTFVMGAGSVGSAPSSGTSGQLEFFRQMTGGTLSPQPLVSGWLMAPAGAELAIVDLNGRPASGPVEWSAGADLKEVPPGLVARRFRIATPCAPADCLLRLRAGEQQLDLPLRTGRVAQQPQARVHIDSLSSELGGPAERKRALQQRIMRAIGLAYAFSFPLLGLGALAGIAFAAARPAVRRAQLPWIALALACLGAALARVALLAYLDVTSIPSGNGSYATPASPFVIVFVAAGLWLGRLAWRDRRRARAASPTPHPDSSPHAAA